MTVILTIFVFGPSLIGLNTMSGSILRNFGELPSLILDAPADFAVKTIQTAYDWRAGWSISFGIWWFAFTPFVILIVRNEIKRQVHFSMVSDR